MKKVDGFAKRLCHSKEAQKGKLAKTEVKEILLGIISGENIERQMELKAFYRGKITTILLLSGYIWPK